MLRTEWFTAAFAMVESAESTQNLGSNSAGQGRALYGPGPRVAAYLRGKYQRPRAKQIARDLGVAEKVVERWLSGHAPTLRHFEEMVDRWGEPFLRSIFLEAFAARPAELSSRGVLGASAALSTELSSIGVVGALAALAGWRRPRSVGQVLPKREALTSGRVAQSAPVVGLTAFGALLPVWWRSPLMRSHRSAFLQELLATVPSDVDN